MSNRRWRPAHTFPCASPTCTAMVEFEHGKCFVHQRWNDGPHDMPCRKCRQTVARGELWRLLDTNDGTSVVHSQCVRRASLNTRRVKEFTPPLFP